MASFAKQLKGIDVSRWQTYINWDRAARNVDFAVIKIGGSDDGLYLDSFAQRNVMEAREHGLPFGVYVYLGGVHKSDEEVAHIKNMIHSIGGLQAGEFLALDWEEHHPQETKYMTNIVSKLIDAGFAAPLIYMSLSRVRGNDWSELVAMGCKLWVAAWGDNDDKPEDHEIPREGSLGAWSDWAIWQFSSTGSVAGIPGRVDLNIFKGDESHFNKLGKSTRVKQPYAIPVHKPALDPKNHKVYVVKSGDSLSKIANRYGRTWQDLWAINRDVVSQPNKIFSGQKLRVWGATHKNPPVPTAVKASRTYIVKPGDNLSEIARRHGYSSWREIYDVNQKTIGQNPNKIYPGQSLRLP